MSHQSRTHRPAGPVATLGMLVFAALIALGWTPAAEAAPAASHVAGEQFVLGPDGARGTDG